jgi:GH24 family phage-related lysozyme (muramidase)
MPKKKLTDSEIIEKMQNAYGDFLNYMGQLEVEASSLVKKAMKAGDTKKVADALSRIKALTNK